MFFLFKFQANWSNPLMKWNLEVIAKEGKEATSWKCVNWMCNHRIHRVQSPSAGNPCRGCVPGAERNASLIFPPLPGTHWGHHTSGDSSGVRQARAYEKNPDQAGRQTHKLTLPSTEGSKQNNSWKQTVLENQHSEIFTYNSTEGWMLPQWLFKLWIVFIHNLNFFQMLLKQEYKVDLFQ